MRLGPFDLDQPIGRGAFAEVWRARHRLARTRVAVKVLRTDQHDVVARFERELAAVAALDHPAIVRALDGGLVPPGFAGHPALPVGAPYLVFEWLEGGTLRPRQGRLTVPEVLRVVQDLLGALAHAHSRGVVHGDLKPANVLRAGDNSVRLADFGMARPFGSQISEIGGTPAYLAPEVLGGAPADAAGDLYALGCLAWALLAGEPPFAGSDPAAVLRAHREAHLPPLTCRWPVPAPLEQFLVQLLAKDPRQRPPTAASAARRLAEALELAPPAKAWRAYERRPAPRIAPDVGLGLLGRRALPLPDRDPQRDRLWALVEDLVSTRRGRLVVLTGPPDSGRSRLARWLAERAEEAGLALAALLRPGQGGRPDPGAWLGEIRTIEEPTVVVVPQSGGAEVLRHAAVLLALLAERPVLLVVPAPHAPSGVEEVEVLPPNREELLLLAGEALDLDAAAVTALEPAAGAGPDALLETLRTWVDRGLLGPGPRGWQLVVSSDGVLPAARAEAVSAELAELAAGAPPAARTLWELAAALGSSFPLRHWVRVARRLGLPEPTEVALSSGVMVLEGEVVRFADWALREGLVAAAQQAGRWVAWHRVIADVLTETAQGAEDTGRLGQHLLRAERPELALVPLLEGATHAVQRDHPDAGPLLRDLAQAIEQQGARAGSPERREVARVELLLLEVEASLAAGRPHRARDQVEQLRSWLEGQTGGAARTAEGARQRRARRLVASWAGRGHLTERVWEDLLQVQEESLVALDWNELCLARLGLARCERRRGDAEACLVTLTSARQAALAARIPRLVAEVVLARVFPLRDLGQLREAQLAAEEALSRFRGLGHRGAMARAALACAQVLRQANRTGEAWSLLNDAQATFEEIRDLSSLLVAHGERGALVRAAGDLERAERELRSALLLAERLGAGDPPGLRLQLALTLLARGELDAARALLTALSVLPRPMLAAVALAGLAELRRRAGDLAGARGELRSLSRVPRGARRGSEVSQLLAGCRSEPKLCAEFPELLVEPA